METNKTEQVADAFEDVWCPDPDDLDHEWQAGICPARADFYKWLAEHDAQVLRDAADKIEARYPKDVFAPMSAREHKHVTDLLGLGGRGITRDRISADVIRFAMTALRLEAAEIERGPVDRA